MKIKGKNGAKSKKYIKLSHKTVEALFQAKFVEFFNSDENPITVLNKAIQKTNEHSARLSEEALGYEKEFSELLKRQETFIHECSVIQPKPTYRTVGVNVDMGADNQNMNDIFDVEEDVSNLNDASSSVATHNLTEQPVKTNAGVVAPSPTDVQAALKSTKSSEPLGSVDLVDLTVEENIMKPPKKLKLSPQTAEPIGKFHGALSHDAVVSRSFLMPRGGNNISRRFGGVSCVKVPFQLPQQFRLQASSVSGKSTFNSPSSGSVSQRFYYAPVNMISRRIGTQDNTGSVLPQKPTSMVAPFTSSALPSTAKGVVPPDRAILASPGTGQTSIGTLSSLPRMPIATTKHPAPLPEQPKYPLQNIALLGVPPKPVLKISKPAAGIVLSWSLPVTGACAQIKTYQLYGYEETLSRPETSLWKRIGDVKALPLPMACTLAEYTEGCHYYFAVRAVDAYYRSGPFSDIVDIHVAKNFVMNS